MTNPDAKVQTIDVSRLPRRKKDDEPPQGFFAARKKIFIREVSGLFNKWRWIMVWVTQIIFYATPWLQWNDRQAFMLDVTQRKFYLFGLVLWPSDVIYLAVLLLISALALFLFTAVAGRLWCGYTCPQTVYTEIFMWIEKKVEGDRVAQMRLDKAPLSAQKIFKKGTKHFLWAAFALWSGFTLVGYFTPTRELFAELKTLSFGPVEWFWILFYGAAMYLLAGWMREQVCKYMCPYARFQSVMFDADTMIVTYDEKRGESRGPRKKGIDPREQGKGDCIDCGVCVDVCPTGIDIRDGLQMECIGCGACIDGCNDIMEKMGYPKNLIRYDTENGVKESLSKEDLIHRILRGRVLIYAAVLVALIGGMAYSLAQRNLLKMSVQSDARAVPRMMDGNIVENVYRVQFANTDEQPHTINVSAHGLNGIGVSTDSKITLAPLSTHTIVLKVQVDQVKARGAGATSGSNPIEIRLKPLDMQGDVLSEKAFFLLPKQE